MSIAHYVIPIALYFMAACFQLARAQCQRHDLVGHPLFIDLTSKVVVQPNVFDVAAPMTTNFEVRKIE